MAMNIQNDYKKNNTGTVVSLSENGDFGFINFESEKTIFFHIKSVIGIVNLDDEVVFSTYEPKNKKHQIEAGFVRKIYSLPNGSSLALSRKIILSNEAQKAVLDLLPTIDDKYFDKENEIVFENEINGTGLSFACSTTIVDDILYANRLNKTGYSRFVNGRQPEISNIFTIIIRFRSELFEVVAAYFGPKSHPEPWDRIATPQSVDFWKTHALIPDPIFKIDYSSVKNFDPNFFKSFEEIQAGEGSLK